MPYRVLSRLFPTKDGQECQEIIHKVRSICVFGRTPSALVETDTPNPSRAHPPNRRRIQRRKVLKARIHAVFAILHHRRRQSTLFSSGFTQTTQNRENVARMWPIPRHRTLRSPSTLPPSKKPYSYLYAHPINRHSHNSIFISPGRGNIIHPKCFLQRP